MLRAAPAALSESGQSKMERYVALVMPGKACWTIRFPDFPGTEATGFPLHMALGKARREAARSLGAGQASDCGRRTSCRRRAGADASAVPERGRGIAFRWARPSSGSGALMVMHLLSGSNGRGREMAVQLASLVRAILIRDQRDEHDRPLIFGIVVALGRARQLEEALTAPLQAHGKHQSAADRKLLLQCRGHVGPAGGDEDGIEWCCLRPAFGALADAQLDVVIAEI